MRLTSKPSLRRPCTLHGTGGDWNGRELLRATRWLAAAVLLVMSLAPAHASGDCPAEVVGYWPLDGDGTERVNGFPGTLVGNATFVPGVVGQALDLPGDGSYLDAGTHAALTDHGGSEMTVAAWIHMEPDGPAGNALAPVITARTFCNQGNWQLYGSVDGYLYYSKWLNGNEDKVWSSFSTPLGTWIHVAATYAADEVRFYVDGALHDVVTPLLFGGAINSFVQNVQIGFDSCIDYWTGSLDEVAVFKATLSASEIQALFEKGLAGVGVCEDDSDGDGTLDADDLCPGTSAGAVVDSASGCSISQLAPCDASWRNHGRYVAAVAQAAELFVELGLITEAEKGAIVSAAAQSGCG